MATITIGTEAPAFSAKDSTGKQVSLADFKGKKVILYFYPKDDTPGCTDEACNLRDNYAGLTAKGFVVIGVSADDEKSHIKFRDKYKLPFILIPDSGKEIIKAYEAWGLKRMYGKSYEGILRKTYIISEDGKIEAIFDKVDTGNHTNQIYDALGII